MANFKIDTPHAAVIIWNYDDRLGTDGPSDPSAVNVVDKVILSTLSCISIETSKAKSSPVGSFQLVLAPFKNWISNITPGSWCTLLMSQAPITEKDLRKANPAQVKMIGKIETVRANTSQNADGTRQTLYYVTGVDWAHVFNNIVYVDNNIAAASDPITIGNGVAIALQKVLFGDKGIPNKFGVRDNLRSILQIFGKPLNGFTQQGTDINRLANAVYNFSMPQKMVEYFGFLDPENNVSKSQELNKVITLYSGVLDRYDHYNNKSEALGFIDPFSLQGAHSFWQLLIENSNPALNEMYPEMRWEPNGLRLTLYNRIKPFSFKGQKSQAGANSALRSLFQNVRTMDIDPVTVTNVNAGTNWRDKYNFVEIKPNIQEFNAFAYWYKQKTQQFDAVAFQREGFRPLILETKQFPGNIDNVSLVGAVDWNQLEGWTALLKEWYFDTHRMLNGTLTMVGAGDYIAVGDNIKFPAGLLNPTNNLNFSTVKDNKDAYLLGHVENVSHRFTVEAGGARTYTTTIQFVRGIIVDSNGNAIGKGTLDKFDSSMSVTENRNTKNINSTSADLDPDPEKIRGT